MSYAVMELTSDIMNAGLYGTVRVKGFEWLENARRYALKLRELEGGEFVVVEVID
jgi:hypothetical protein